MNTTPTPSTSTSDLDQIEDLDLGRIMSSPPPHLDFVLPGLLAGGLGVLVAAGGGSKTTLALQVAAGIATGTPIAGGLMQPTLTGPAIVLAGEDPKLLLETKIRALGLSLAENHGVALDEYQGLLRVRPMHGRPMFLCEKDRSINRSVFDHFCRLCDGSRLMVIDTLARIHLMDENSAGDMTLLAVTLEEIQRKTGCTIILLHHCNKGAVKDNLAGNAAAGRGSSAITNSCRWQAYLQSLDEDTAKNEWPSLGRYQLTYRHITQFGYSKANYLAPQEPVWLARGEEGLLTRLSPEVVAGMRTRPAKAAAGNR